MSTHITVLSRTSYDTMALRYTTMVLAIAICLGVAAPPVTTAAMLILVPIAVIPQMRQWRSLPGVLPVLALTLLAAASSIWSRNLQGLDRAVVDLAVAGVAGAGIATVSRSQTAVRVLAGSYVLGSSVIAARFFLANGIHFVNPLSSAEASRYTIEGLNANFLAYQFVTALAVLPIAIPRPRRSVWLAVAVATSAAITITMTGSRGAAISLALLCAWIFVQHFVVRRRRQLMAALVWVPPITSVPGWVDAWLKPQGSSLRETGDLNGRLTAWPVARQLFEAHPFLGNGMGTFEFISGFGMRTHNAYLAFASELGLVGLFLFCLALHRFALGPRGTVPTSGAAAILLASVPLLYTGAWERATPFWIAMALASATNLQVSENSIAGAASSADTGGA